MRRTHGFTIIELMVVCTIIVGLVTMAVPIYIRQVQRTKEAVLKSDLFTMRTAISRFMFEQGKAPRGLNDLKMAGFLVDIPVDPMTGSNGTWKADPEDAKSIMDSDHPGVGYVHSGSPKIGLDGTRYADW